MVQFDFTAARVNEDGELCLKVINTPAARQFVLGMRERMYTCEVKEYRQKRSLDANAYFGCFAISLQRRRTNRKS